MLSVPQGSVEYTIQRVMVIFNVLLPFPKAARSFPVDQILPDNRRQLSLHFIPADKIAPWWGDYAKEEVGGPIFRLWGSL